MGRTVGIWITGTLASAIFGGLNGHWLDQYGSGWFFGAIGGALAFACVRMWLVQKDTSGRSPSP